MHSFDPTVAAEVGVVPAVLYQNIVYWTKRNASEGERNEDDHRPRHFHEGRWWTFNSVSGLSRLFPYLTQEQIRRALEKLESAGLVAVGYFHRDRFNRSKWYSPLRQTDLAELSDASGENAKPSGKSAESTYGKSAESYADITANITTDGKPRDSSAQPTLGLEGSLQENDKAPAEVIPLKAKRSSHADDVDEAIRCYHVIAERRGLSTVKILTPERRRKLIARLGECGGIEGWKDALRILDQTPMCHGDNDRGWRANLDFLLQPSSFVKLVEGAYANKRLAPQARPEPNVEAPPTRKNALTALPMEEQIRLQGEYLRQQAAQMAGNSSAARA